MSSRSLIPELPNDTSNVREPEDSMKLEKISYSGDSETETDDSFENTPAFSLAIKKVSTIEGDIVPLSQFGSFDIESSIRELKWIKDHTSGKVHPDMPTISMLYNQNLKLPEEAEKFIAQSSALKEEARWEKLKAVFYGIYPEEIRDRACHILEGLSALEARRIISMKTSRFEHEILLKPLISGSDTKENLERVNKELKTLLSKVKGAVIDREIEVNASQSLLSGYTTFLPKINIFSSIISDKQSSEWPGRIEMHQYRVRACTEAKLLEYQLSHSEARVDTRTEWIHVRTEPLHCSIPHISSLAFTVARLTDDKCMSSELRDRSSLLISSQMKIFEYQLHKRRAGVLLEYDILHNSDLYEAYDFRIPYKAVDPALCLHILADRFDKNSPLHSANAFEPISTPDVSGFPRTHHDIRLYIMSNLDATPTVDCRFGSTLVVHNFFDFCINCFAKDHCASKCKESKYGYACG